jgi:hypothetical protein
MSRRRHMSTGRQYELVYIVPPETSEDAIAELHTDRRSRPWSNASAATL